MTAGIRIASHIPMDSCLNFQWQKDPNEFGVATRVAVNPASKCFYSRLSHK